MIGARPHTNGNAGPTLPPIIPYPLCVNLLDWTSRHIAPPDYLLGELLSTTSRLMLVGPTGLGKTMLMMGIAFAIAEGRDFLGWRGRRPARVLYIDGEMSSTLMQRRIIDALGRAGGIDHPENPHFVCLNDLPTRPPPLNTEAGQKYMDNVIDDCGSEFLFLDNIQALLSGDMKDEEPWRNVLPWIYSLTKRKIGQAWVHHTGHDETHSYGSSTREWQLDAVGLLERLSDGPGDIGFKLRFTKARERTPENREDYEAKIIRLVDNQWSAEPVERQGGMSRQAAKSSKPKSPSPLATKFYDALIDALAHTGERRQDSAGLPSATDDQWRGELCRLGLVPEGDDKVTQHSRRSLISKYRRELIAANWIACNGELSWSIREGGR